MSEEAPRLRIRGLAKSFDGTPVLTDVDLDVGIGESLAVIGQSGTGKSVLIKCVLGLLHPDSGSILIDGEEMVGAKAETRRRLRAKFGMLFQGGALFDSLPVWRNVTFGLTQGRAGRVAEMREIAVTSLRRVGLDADILDRRPSEISGGMQKRVALARAIAPGPEILLFDEPTTGLDPIRAGVINELICALVADLGVTALTITHDMVSARRVAHHVAMLHEGRIVWHGTRAQLDSSGNAYVDQFVKGRSDEGAC
ncbi:MAG TPA: ATP-binding cassette domain-containing protein [Sphingomonadaceae bacterium]|nr:ATP-binding cassette domain-containing protein [Sphingomonadaceae bacterium]